MSTEKPKIDIFGPNVDIIDKSAGHVDKMASNRHIRTTCRFRRQILQSHVEHR